MGTGAVQKNDDREGERQDDLALIYAAGYSHASLLLLGHLATTLIKGTSRAGTALCSRHTLKHIISSITIARTRARDVTPRLFAYLHLLKAKKVRVLHCTKVLPPGATACGKGDGRLPGVLLIVARVAGVPERGDCERGPPRTWSRPPRAGPSRRTARRGARKARSGQGLAGSPCGTLLRRGQGRR